MNKKQPPKLDDFIKMQYMDLPTEVGGFVVQRSESDYIVVLNRCICPLLLCKVAGHELCHVLNNHYAIVDNHLAGIKTVEAEADAYAWSFFREHKTFILQKWLEGYSVR